MFSYRAMLAKIWRSCNMQMNWVLTEKYIKIKLVSQMHNIPVDSKIYALKRVFTGVAVLRNCRPQR